MLQKKYLNLDLDPTNGQYLLTVFHLIPKHDTEENFITAATEVAAESSTGSNIPIRKATPFADSLNAIVYKLDYEKRLAWIAYQWRQFDRGGNVQNILTYIAGNIFGMSDVVACKLLDVWFPQEMLDNYDGPSYTLMDMRNYLNVHDRPILGTIIKPKIGFTPSEYAQACYEFWSGGGDFVKNDEPQADQDFCDYFKMVDKVREAMDRAEDETGTTKVHSFNVSAPDFDTMLKRADYVISKMKPGSFAFLIDGITAGWMAVQTLRRHYPNVFLHFHRAGHGAMTRPENPIGYTVPVLTKFARLAGASGLHTGTAGIGKMKGSVHEDIVAANMALDLVGQGHFFKQNWGIIDGIKDKIDTKKANNNENIINTVLDFLNLRNESEHTIKERSFGIFFEQPWHTIKPMCPIISGGLNPLKLRPFIEVMQGVDFITTMGGGVHSHPSGTKAGAQALVASCEAWKKNIPLEEYAKSHKPLQEALEYYGKEMAHAYDFS